MIAFGRSILYTPGWEAFNVFSAVAGLFGIVIWLFIRTPSRKLKIAAGVGMGLLVLSIAFSMFFESILPAWPTMPEERRIPYALSYAGFMAFAPLFVHSARMLFGAGVIPYFMLLRKGEAGPERAELGRQLRPAWLWVAGTLAVFGISLVGYHGWY